VALNQPVLSEITTAKLHVAKPEPGDQNEPFAGTLRDKPIQSTDTVVAVERRSGQMELWLSMMGTMTESSDQVQLATQVQRATVDQAAAAIEHIAQSSQSVAATAKDIALAASRQDRLAAEPSDSWDEHLGMSGTIHGA